MFLYVSVILSQLTGGGQRRCVWSEGCGSSMPHPLYGQASTPPTRHPHLPPDQASTAPPPPSTTGIRSMRRSVRILLECILVRLSIVQQHFVNHTSVSTFAPRTILLHQQLSCEKEFTILSGKTRPYYVVPRSIEVENCYDVRYDDVRRTFTDRLHVNNLVAF